MTDEKKRDDKEPGRAIAAVFGSREEAHQTLGALHKAHFRKVWFGVTSVATTAQGTDAMTVESSGGFFSQKSQGLVDALVEHDVDGAAARGLVATIQPGNALLTVDPDKGDPNEAIEILQRHGARIEGGMAASGARSAVPSRAASDYAPVTATPATATPDDDMPVWEEETFFQHPAR